MQHVLILRCMYICMYLCQSRLGPGASYASAARVSRGYINLHGCARTRVAWLHGLRACRMVAWFAPMRMSLGYMVCLALALALALPRVAGSMSFNAVAFTSNNYICAVNPN